MNPRELGITEKILPSFCDEERVVIKEFENFLPGGYPDWLHYDFLSFSTNYQDKRLSDILNALVSRNILFKGNVVVDRFLNIDDCTPLEIYKFQVGQPGKEYQVNPEFAQVLGAGFSLIDPETGGILGRVKDRKIWALSYRPIERKLLMRNKDYLSVERTAEGLLPTKTGLWHIVAFRQKDDNEEHVALSMGDITTDEPLLTRLHSSCVTAETFHATNCDCHEQMEVAMQIIAKKKRGLIVWLHQEGRGNGLAGKVMQLKEMMERDIDTVTAFESLGMSGEARNYKAAIDIYKDLGIKAPLRLLTHNPNKITALKDAGFQVEIEPLTVPINSDITERDLAAKKSKLGHLYD